LKNAYENEVLEYNKSMKKVLKDGFDLNGEEIFVFLSTSEINVN